MRIVKALCQNSSIIALTWLYFANHSLPQRQNLSTLRLCSCAVCAHQLETNKGGGSSTRSKRFSRPRILTSLVSPTSPFRGLPISGHCTTFMYSLDLSVSQKHAVQCHRCPCCRVLEHRPYVGHWIWNGDGVFYYILDDEIGHRSKVLPSSSGIHAARLGIAQIFLELLLVMMSSFPREKVVDEDLEKTLAIDEVEA
jgi:hypothetical protein